MPNELSELGIHTQSPFKVPGTDLILDLYIKAPIRGIIEIKSPWINQHPAGFDKKFTINPRLKTPSIN